jgi:D-alanine-D-alanine ligase
MLARMHNSLPDRRVGVAVIFGGRNTEHSVSCHSAESVMLHLDRDRYEVVPVYISRDGAWSVRADDLAAAEEAATPPRADGWSPLPSMVDALRRLRSVDVILPCLHGPYGEDGTLQGLLDLIGVPYVGSGVLASAAAMDKEFAKKVVSAEGIAVTDGVVLRAGDLDVAPADRTRLGLPVFVKPARGGSSLGVTRVDDWKDLPAAIRAARRADSKVLIEAAQSGREIDVALLEGPDGTVAAGPALEIKVASDSAFFDFEAKYEASTTRFVIPADLDERTSRLLADSARRVFDALGCAGLLRVDFFLTVVDGRAVPVFNEANSLPGLTELSQFPQVWQADGVSYPELLDRLLTVAMSQHRHLAPAGRR